MNNIDKANDLHENAKILLQNKIEPDYLKCCDKVVYTGSYDLDLMAWRDIDLQIILPNDKSKLDYMLAISKELLLDANCKNIKIINFSLVKKEGMPKGIYIGASIKDENTELQWKVDIWALEDNDRKINLEFQEQIKSKLSPKLREFILNWKFAIMAKGRLDRMPHLASYYLYQAILFENLRKDQEIYDFLRQKGVAI